MRESGNRMPIWYDRWTKNRDIFKKSKFKSYKGGVVQVFSIGWEFKNGRGLKGKFKFQSTKELKSFTG